MHLGSFWRIYCNTLSDCFKNEFDNPESGFNALDDNQTRDDASNAAQNARCSLDHSETSRPRHHDWSLHNAAPCIFARQYKNKLFVTNYGFWLLNLHLGPFKKDEFLNHFKIVIVV